MRGYCSQNIPEEPMDTLDWEQRPYESQKTTYGRINSFYTKRTNQIEMKVAAMFYEFCLGYSSHDDLYEVLVFDTIICSIGGKYSNSYQKKRLSDISRRDTQGFSMERLR